MVQTYNALEGELTVRGSASSTRTGATNAAAIVGGFNSAASASDVNAGEATEISDPATAEDEFGDSEIPRAAQVAAANGVGTLYGVPVAETTTTESISSGSSITLSNTPLFDPNVHPDQSVTVTDTDTSTDLDVNIVYDDNPSTPSSSDTANVNPINGKVEIDASGNYDVNYTYGDYSAAIEAAADQDVRSIIVLTESPSVKSTLNTELSDRANDFDFMRGYTGAKPEIATGSISGYTPDEEDWRIVEVAPARGTGADGEVRTAAAVGGYMTAQPVDASGSGLFDPIGGIESLNTEYRPSQAKDFSQVTAITRGGTLASTVTTSSESQFANIYATEVIDTVALSLFSTARSYAGGPQDVNELETLLSVQCQAFSRGSLPLLGFGDGRDERPYDVTVSLDNNDSSIANAGVTIVPLPIAEEVNLDLTVTDGFVQFNGAN